MPDAVDATTSDAPAGVDEALLGVLRCPLTLSPLRQEGNHLVAEVGGLRYPIRDRIPQMIVDEAELPAGVASLNELRTRLREQGVHVRD